VTQPIAHDSHSRQKKLALAGVALAALVVGPVEVLLGLDDDQDLVVIAEIVTILVLVLNWCKHDSLQRGFSLRKPLLILIALFLVVGLSVYLLQTRGRRGVLSILAAVAFGVALTILQTVAIRASYALFQP